MVLDGALRSKLDGWLSRGMNLELHFSAAYIANLRSRDGNATRDWSVSTIGHCDLNTD